MRKLYEGNIRRNFFIFAFPLILTALFSQAYSIINTIMAGKLIGDNAISAIGSTAPFVSMISSLFWGYATGFSIYVAILFGKGDSKKMLNVIKVNILVSSLVVLTISFLCIILHEYIFDFLNIDESIRKDAFLYFGIYMSGLVFLHITWCLGYISNAIGHTILPLGASLISNILNISGNYVLVKYTDMGVGATALATVGSALVVIIFYLYMLYGSFKKYKIPTKGIYFSKDELKMSWEYAFPTMLQQSVMYMCTAFVSPLTNKCGAAAIAGYTIGMRIYDLNAAVYQNSNKTVSNYIAQCIGAKKYNMIKPGIRTGIIQTSIFLLPLLIATVFGAKYISGIFLNEPDSIHFSIIFMRYCMPFVIFNVINNLAHAIFRSAGAGKILVASTLVYSISRFAYSYILYPKFEMYGIFLAVILSWITEAVLCIFIYATGRWKNEEYKLNEMMHR